MTTTDTFQGMGEGKNSSRVLRPPGGGSSDIFGTGSVAHASNAAQEKKENAKRNAGSNIFGGASEEPQDQPGVKHINRKPHPSSQSTIFGDHPTGADLKKRNQGGEEFPAYDRSVYVAQMTPQRRNIQQVSTYNPITNESYAGYERQDQQDTSPIKRRGQYVNQGSSYNVITNQTYDEQIAKASPIKPGKRTLSNSNADEGTYNPITGELIGGKNEEVQKNSSRVTNPPGGKSSGLW